MAKETQMEMIMRRLAAAPSVIEASANLDKLNGLRARYDAGEIDMETFMLMRASLMYELANYYEATGDAKTAKTFRERVNG